MMDPPYYNNVTYAELADFFYVWLKRTAGYVLFPNCSAPSNGQRKRGHCKSRQI